MKMVTTNSIMDPTHDGLLQEDPELDQSYTTSRTSATATQPPSYSFPWDNAKPWFSFGSAKAVTNNGPAWVPDEAVNACQACEKPFDFLFNRKHHCRYCGRIFCASCSGHAMLLPEEFGVREPQRTCASCALELQPRQEELIETISNQKRVVEYDPQASANFLASPVSFSMTAEIQKATHSVENIFGHAPNALVTIDRAILPETLIQKARGVAFLTVVKGGFLFSGKIGTGLVVARLDSQVNGTRWSAPTAIGTAGLGWGAQIGGELTDFVLILTTDEAVEAFSGTSQVALGAQLGVSLGPLGRTGDATLNISDRGISPCYAYSQSSGLFAGASFEGSIITSRSDVNLRFYGKEHLPRNLLNGTALPPPVAAAPLYRALDKVFSISQNGGLFGDAASVHQIQGQHIQGMVI